MKTAAVRFYDELPVGPDLRGEVMRGLAATPKSIPPKFFYDQRGSQLFDAICGLPEYYLTRTETAILRDCAGEVAQLVGPGAVFVEFGAGATEKVRLLLDVVRPVGYLGIDISREFLLAATRRLAHDYPWLEVHAACADFCRPMKLTYPPSTARRLVLFPGSSIGNLTPAESEEFLAAQRALVGDGGFLIGVDFKKDTAVLHAAYNDSQGITADFNLNLLARIKRELGAEVDLDGFAHEAVYNADAGRIEMYLISRRSQAIAIDGERFEFAAGERLHTENSYKYGLAEFQALARRAGYEPVRAWTDAQARFGVHYLRVAR